LFDPLDVPFKERTNEWMNHVEEIWLFLLRKVIVPGRRRRPAAAAVAPYDDQPLLEKPRANECRVDGRLSSIVHR
jgi:hypothetical protein